MTDEQPVNRPPALRVSDAEREQVAERLRIAAGEGRLTVEELAERIDKAYDARTQDELVPLMRDLPEPSRHQVAAPAEGTPARKPPGKWMISIMGGGDRRGRWRVGQKFNSIAIMGGGTIDLREATLEAAEVHITAVAFMGGIDVIVPPGVDVEVSGFDFMGGRDIKLGNEQPPPGAPRVVIRAHAIMGGIDIVERRSSRHPAADPPDLRWPPRPPDLPRPPR